jgi:FMN-dependent NADH-azoreductase
MTTLTQATPTLLHIAASPRTSRSRSKQVASKALDQTAIWHVVERDLGRLPPSFITEGWIAAGAETDLRGGGPALHESRELIAEIKSADALLISSPMYNWTIPANLKAWIDLITVEGETFDYVPNAQPELQPRLGGLPAMVIVSAGEGDRFAKGGPSWAINHFEPYLETLFNIIGIGERHFAYTSDHDAADIDRAAAEVGAWLAQLKREMSDAA